MNHPKHLERQHFFANFKFAGGFLLAIWIVAFLETLRPELMHELGLVPRDVDQATGIITMWLVHKDLAHLLSNTPPLFFLTLFVLMIYPKIAWRVFGLSIFMGGLLLWCFGRGNAYHIGASGFIYALAGFLFFSGIFRRDRKSIGAALLVAFLYGGLVWGIFPIYKDVSWDGHLFGAIGGTLIAFFYRDYDRPEEEETNDPPVDAPYWRPDLPPEGWDD